MSLLSSVVTIRSKYEGQWINPPYISVYLHMELALLSITLHTAVSSVGRVVAPLTGWYWVRTPVGLALHVISPHPRVCKL